MEMMSIGIMRTNAQSMLLVKLERSTDVTSASCKISWTMIMMFMFDNIHSCCAAFLKDDEDDDASSW
jgi:hypothetical protein